MRHFLYVAIALVMIGIGLVLFPLPIPLGAPMMAVGVAILISHSRLAARVMTVLRVSYPGFNRLMDALETKAPRTVARGLRRTRPATLRYFGLSRDPGTPL